MAKRRELIGAMAALPLTQLGGCMAPLRSCPQASPLEVRGSLETLEIAPVLLAARNSTPGSVIVRNGGIGNLVGAPRVASLGDEGGAHVATHAETQALRYSVANPEIRIILTVTEGQYRIVARRSAGIASLANLKGKRIATLATTSAGFFLARMLEQARLRFDDVTAVRISPIGDMAPALARGEVDAMAIWEPHAGDAVHLLGTDAITFPGDGIYRELFNLNSTAANLANPVRRPQIVQFVRAVIDASAAIRRDPAAAQQLVATTGQFAPDRVRRAWSTLTFNAHLPHDLLDMLAMEERWLAAQEGRTPRARETLSNLIDPSVLADAKHA